MCACVCVRMCICVCACMCGHVCACVLGPVCCIYLCLGGQRLTGYPLLPLTTLVLRQLSHWILTGQEFPGSACPCHSLALGTRSTLAHWALCRLGSRLRSSCLCSKHFIHCVISQAPLLIFESTNTLWIERVGFFIGSWQNRTLLHRMSCGFSEWQQQKHSRGDSPTYFWWQGNLSVIKCSKQFDTS